MYINLKGHLMRVCFYTLGCKVNLNETGALEQMFRSAGFTIVPEGEEADVFVVNSCTVTNFGDQKSRKWLRRAKRENPGAVTVLTGCYPQAFPEEAAQFMEADLVCGNGDRKAILDNVLKLLDGHERIVAIAPHAKGERFEELPVERFETHTRAFIKVEDGCNRQCAYCVIPRARGPVRSRSEESILAELRQLAASGYREVVLSAISLPSYGLDTGTNLVELVEKCARVEGIERIRLGSLDPDMLTPEYITRLAAVDKLCPQYHLSLQSGCSATLRRMRRVYTAEQYAEVVRQLRAAYGRSTNRPEFRELSSSVYYDFDLGSSVMGNPDLKAATIDNADLRWEWYPSRGEQISVALFYKHFAHPIEWTYTVAGGTDLIYSFINANGANNYGVELDIRKNLGFIGLRDFSLSLNGALIKSQVTFDKGTNNIDRPMQGQSPYLVNAGLFYNNDEYGWNAALLYNIIGKRITGVGNRYGTASDGTARNIPNSYEMPRHSLDISVSKKFGRWSLKLSARDILAQRYLFKQIEEVTNEGKGKTIEETTRSYKPGRNFNITIGYNF